MKVYPISSNSYTPVTVDRRVASKQKADSIAFCARFDSFIGRFLCPPEVLKRIRAAATIDGNKIVMERNLGIIERNMDTMRGLSKNRRKDIAIAQKLMAESKTLLAEGEKLAAENEKLIKEHKLSGF